MIQRKPSNKRIRICGILCVCGGIIAGAAAAEPAVVSAQPGNVFFVTDVVRFTAHTTEKRLTVQVTDFSGRKVIDGAYATPAITLGRLPRGYYEITAGVDARPVPFVVLPHPRPYPLGRIGVDAALSWLVPQSKYEEGAELLRRAGFAWARDRISWGEIEPARGRYDWGRYDRSADVQAKHGIRIDQVFHDTPKWARSDGATNRFPDDLRDVYRFAQHAAEHYKGKVHAWEVWNEADIPMFLPDSGAEYAAFLKAAYLGFKAGDPSIPVTQTAFALAAEPFAASLIANGADHYYDIFNYHDYESPEKLPTRTQGHLARIGRGEASGRPVWLTEAGIPLHAVDGALSPADARSQADYIPKSYVASLANGTDRHFFFVFPHYIENGVEFGVLNADFKPYPGYAALATVNDALGEAKYRGEIRYRQPGLHMYVFDSGEADTLVAWSDMPNVKVPVMVTSGAIKGPARARALDVVGSALPLSEMVQNGALRLTLSPSPIYVSLPHGTLTQAITPPGPPGLSPAKRERSAMHDIVVRLLIPAGRVDKAAEALHIANSTPAHVDVQIYNFGAHPFTGLVELTAPEGWTLDRTRVPISTLPSLGLTAVTVSLTPASSGANRASIRGAALSSRGDWSSPAIVDVIRD